MNRIAKTEDRIFLAGDLGNRQAVVAFGIHQASQRCNETFEVIRCTGLTDAHVFQLLTGVVDEEGELLDEGALIRANQGSLCIIGLDEMGPKSQAALEGFLTSGQFFPTGAQMPEISDIRVISTANSDLRKLVDTGKFRQNLYYLLTEQVIVVPSLSQQPDRLEETLAQQLKEIGASAKTLDSGAIEQLKIHGYFDDRRELRNILKRTVARYDDRVIGESQIITIIGEAAALGLIPSVLSTSQSNIDETSSSSAAHSESDNAPAALVIAPGEQPPDLVEYDRRYWVALMSYVAGDKKQAADIAGISLRTLYRRLEAAGL